jgi:hypothetical protein
VNIDPISCKSVGLHISKDTCEWWAKQSKTAQHSWQTNQIDIKEALLKFEQWFSDGQEYSFWANGISFDAAVLKTAYSRCKMVAPWDYHREMDMRTLCKVLGIDVRAIRAKSDKTFHDALEDSLEQTRILLDNFGVEAF